MSLLDQEIAAFEADSARLESHHMGKWVVFKGGSLQGTFDAFDGAARFAVEKFGRGPYLIREVGEDRELPIPASVLLQPITSGHR